MELDPGILHKLLHGLESAGPDRRRRRPRGRHGGWVRLTLCTGELDAPVVNALVWNLSAGGAGLVVGRPLRPGSQFILHLPHPDAEQVDILCNVVHARPKRGELLNIGAEFVVAMPRVA